MASGDTLIKFLPTDNEPPATNYATLDVRNLHPVLDFDDTTNESAVFTGVMPRHYSGTTGITVAIHSAATTATTGDFDWDIAFERIGTAQDLDSDGFATAKSANNNTVSGTSGVVTIVDLAFTDGAEIDSIAVGEAFRLKITRDAVSDTASGDAELVALELRDT